MTILETERLLLRQFTLADAPFIFELLNTPTWLRFIGDRGVRSLEDAENYLRGGSIKSYEVNGFGFYAVIEKESQKMIGMCGLIKRDGLDDIDIGFAFLPDVIGKGYGTEAAQAMLKYSFNQLKIRRLVAIVNPDNDASISVIKKIGMQFEKLIILDEKKQNLMLFAIEKPNQN
ncbi:MAG: GNAT family N-acetyltransferase [Spirosomaceae bacterium]|jgi:RimJ/RimL family protein N-acetyltransferase|nr:GNAT family N-acetyltransferase [Spirosomataceae bacterium]